MNRSAVDRLFADAVELPPPERAERLAAESDPDVRAAAARLLARHDTLETDPASAGILAGLDLALAARLVDETPAIPALIGRFMVERELGRGATGTVYLARDPVLGRAVAIKLLAAELGADPLAVRRFTDEARTASGLDHPAVVTVFETGQADDGRLYMVMAHHGGETLRHRLERGPLPIVESLAIARAVCDGLAAAHAAGVVHCDIKPENILLTPHGPRILDFGIARIMGDRSVRARLGTAAYMSPEQVTGSVVDHRSDLWSLGVTLQEMVTGRRPFPATHHADLLADIIGQPPEPPRDVPWPVARLLERCLQKAPGARYPSAAALLQALEGAAVAGTAPRIDRRWVGVSGAVVALVAIGALLTRRAASRTGTEAPLLGVAVVPYRTVGPDVGYLAEGMVDLLSFNVDGVPGLRKIAPATVLSAWRASQGDTVAVGRVGDPLAVARRVGAAFVVTGSAVQSGSEIRLTADVRDVASGRMRGSAQVTGPLDSVPGLVDRLMIELLRQQHLPADDVALPLTLAANTTTSLPALKAYLAGERAFRVARWQEAGQRYLEALGHDSTFARALYRLVKANDWGAGLGPTAAYIARLRPLVAGLPERDRMLITGGMGHRLWPERDVDQAAYLAVLDTLVRRYPDDVDGWVALGDRYYHDRGVLLLPARHHRQAFTTALRLNPYLHEPYLHLMDEAYAELDSAAVRRLATALAATGRASRWCGPDLLRALTWGTPPERERARRALDTIPAPLVMTECLPAVMPPVPSAGAPHLLALAERLADSVLAVAPGTGPFLSLRTRMLLPYGRIAALQQALDALDGRLERRLASWPARWHLILHLLGVGDPVRADIAAASLAQHEDAISRFWRGVHAAQRGEWDAAQREVARIEGLVAAGEGTPAIGTAHARLLQAFLAVRREGPEALPAFERALRRQPPEMSDGPQQVLRYLVGMARLDAGDLPGARRYMESFGELEPFGRLADFQLARIAVRQGRSVEARERYARVAVWWQDADPSLQPWVAEARRGAQVSHAPRPSSQRRRGISRRTTTPTPGGPR